MLVQGPLPLTQTSTGAQTTHSHRLMLVQGPLPLSPAGVMDTRSLTGAGATPSISQAGVTATHSQTKAGAGATPSLTSWSNDHLLTLTAGAGTTHSHGLKLAHGQLYPS